MPDSVARSIDDYLAGLGAEQRKALEKLRAVIRSAAPGAEEGFSYGLPAFRLAGKPLVSFGAAAKHCAFYPMSPAVLAAHREELDGYDTSKGTIRFSPAKPLPAGLVRKIVKERLADLSGGLARRKVAGKFSRKQTTSPDGDPGAAEVDTYLATLDHPLKSALEELRQVIRGVSPKVREGVKWNSPSFRTSDYFATINVHGKDRLRLILHTGAKKKPTTAFKIDDPSGLLEWLAKDRCLVTFHSGGEVRGRRPALARILKAWIRQLDQG